MLNRILIFKTWLLPEDHIVNKFFIANNETWIKGFDEINPYKPQIYDIKVGFKGVKII